MNTLQAETISIENGRKLDELTIAQREMIMLLKGSGEDVPGVLSNVAKHANTLYGPEGVVIRVAILWRVQGWLLGAVCTGLGFVIKTLIDMFAHHP